MDLYTQAGETYFTSAFYTVVIVMHFIIDGGLSLSFIDVTQLHRGIMGYLLPVVVNGIVKDLGKCVYLLVIQKLDEKIDTVL